MTNVLNKYFNTVPNALKPSVFEEIRALLEAFAGSDQTIQQEINNAKDQLFIKTAGGTYLTASASSVGVSKPANIGITDEAFRELIPNLSLKPKQIRKAFYDTADVFWGPLYTRANITSLNSETFNVSTGETIVLKVDGGEELTITISAGEIAIDGAATAAELSAIINDRNLGVTASVIEDVETGDLFLNLRTNTPGPTGTVEVVSGTMLGASKLDFELGEVDILDLDEQFVVYHVNNNEIILVVPATLPIIRRVLKGSHHFHEDSTLEGPVPTENGIWAGSFLYEANGDFTITSQSATLTKAVSVGDVGVVLEVDDTSGFVAQSGSLIFGFGSDTQEEPVLFTEVPNTNTILIDPTHAFQFNHAIGTKVNVLSSNSNYSPRIDGTDLPIYFTSPSEARDIVLGILSRLAATGIVIRTDIAYPDYQYLIDNPYNLEV